MALTDTLASSQHIMSPDVFLTALKSDATSLPPIANPSRTAAMVSSAPVVVPSQPFVSESTSSSIEQTQANDDLRKSAGSRKEQKSASGSSLDAVIAERLEELARTSSNPPNFHQTSVKLPPAKQAQGSARKPSRSVSRSKTFAARDAPWMSMVDFSDDAYSEFSQEKENMSLFSANGKCSGVFNRGPRGATAGHSTERTSEFPEISERLVHTCIDELGHSKGQFPALTTSQNNRDDVYYTPYRFKLDSKPGQIKPPKYSLTRSSSSVSATKKTNTISDLRNFQRNNKSRLRDSAYRPSRYHRVVSDSVEARRTTQQEQTATQRSPVDNCTPRPITSINSPRRKKGVTCSANKLNLGCEEDVNQGPRDSKTSADITAPIYYLHSRRGDVLSDDYDSLPKSSKVRFAKSNMVVSSKENLNIKPSVLRKLNSILKNKASWKRLHESADLDDGAADIDEIRFVHPGYADQDLPDPNKLKGRKVQRGNFITKHSKWTTLMQPSQKEREDYPTVVKLEREPPATQNREVHPSTMRNYEGTMAQSVHPPQSQKLETQAGIDKTTGKDVYRVTLSDKTVLLINHKSKRESPPPSASTTNADVSNEFHSARINGRVHPLDTVPADDASRAGSQTWVPPNTPFVEERRPSLGQLDYSGAHEIDRLELIDEYGITVSRMYSVNDRGNKFTFEHKLG